MAFPPNHLKETKRGESPFANLYSYILLSLAAHAFTFVYFSNTIYLQNKKNGTHHLLTAKINTKTTATTTNTIKNLKKQEPSTQSKTTAPTVSQQTSPLLPPLDTPYLASELDTQPEPLSDIDLDDIFESENSNTGKIEFLLLISKNGTAIWEITEYSDHSSLVTEKIVSLFQKSTYKPGTKDGNPVNSLIRFEVNHSREPN